MSVLPDDASFEERVYDCFLAVRGSGVMLSSLDAELVWAWGQKNVPYDVVARGIQRAAEKAMWDARPGEPALKSLRACRRAVEAEIKKYLDRAVGSGAALAAPEAQEAVSVTRHKKLKAALRKLARTDARVGWAVERLLSGALAAPPSSWEQSARQEETALVALLRALPWAERAGVLREVRARLLGLGAGGSLSAFGRKTSRRFHRAALVRKRLDLPPFW